MSSLDRWVSRLLDTDEEVNPRVCMVTDYLRALRLLGHLRPELLQVWRDACVTQDPLVNGGAAVGQLRLFLESVERQIGTVPSMVPMVDYVPNLDEGAIRQARQNWATNIMAAVLSIGSRPRSMVSNGPSQPEEEQDPVETGMQSSGEPLTLQSAEAPAVSEVFNEHEADSQAMAMDMQIHADHQVGQSELMVRKVQVLSGLRALGQCLVHLLPQDSGYVVFSQVCDFLTRFCQVPPLPRWIYIGESFEKGEHVDPNGPFASLVQEKPSDVLNLTLVIGALLFVRFWNNGVFRLCRVPLLCVFRSCAPMNSFQMVI